MTRTMPGTAAGSRRNLAAGDDGQRLLLYIALRDAGAWHEQIQAACADCQAALEHNRACAGHQAEEDRFRAGVALQSALDYDADWRTLPYHLTVAQRRVIEAALSRAIAYRSERTAAEDAALTAAYRELGRQLAAAVGELAELG